MPRIRQRLFVARETGDADMACEVLPDADLDQRIRDLKATVPSALAADPDAIRRCALCCDGCGAVIELDYDNPRKPEGWTEQADGDYCPACTF